MNARSRTLLLSAVWVFGVAAFGASGQSGDTVLAVNVPSTANPYLAGMPDGTGARAGDSAPSESPLLVELSLDHAVAFSFTASGLVEHAPFNPPEFYPPNGSNVTRHEGGAEHGISDITAPMNSLLGVFLGEERPDQTRAPKPFKPRGSGANSLTLSPALKQVFFIGSGATREGARRRYLVPKGATRLFLGVMDGYEWNNNQGSFSVYVAVERSDVSSSMFSVDSRVTFAQWACLPDRSQCTPERAVVRETGRGQYHVLLPAHLEWGVSIAMPSGKGVNVLRPMGTVCLDSQSGNASSCSGPEGRGQRSGEGFLAPDKAAGALVRKITGSHVYFSVNDRSGTGFQKHQGYFEFDVVVK